MPIPEGAIERVVPARRSFAAGLILMWLGMVLAIWH
jgi:hypothetical protein